MIYFVRSAEIDRGRIDEAASFAVRIASWINEKFPEVNIQVLRNVSGPLSHVHWLARYDSLAQSEELMGRIQSEQEYQGMVAESAEKGLFTQGSFRDSFYRTVP